MTSLTTTCCPNSFQLRLALSCRKPPAVFYGMRVRKLERRGIPLFLFAGTNYSSNCFRRRNTWVNSTSSVDGLGGWVETDDVAEKSVDSKGKQSIADIVVAGAAGVILVTGLTFAALCMGKWNSTRVKQQMNPLTVLQEMPMASDNHDDTVEDGKFLENSQTEKVLQALPGKVQVPAAVDQVQRQALAALQVLKLCTKSSTTGFESLNSRLLRLIFNLETFVLIVNMLAGW